MIEKYTFSNITEKIKELRKKHPFDGFFDKIKYHYNFEKFAEIILTQYKFHEVAELFPLASEEELRGMARDIHEKGLIDKIRTYNELIVDGRNRILACIIAGVEPQYRPLKKGISPLDYAISKNVHRRHMKPAQKADLALHLDCKIKNYSDEAKKSINTVFKEGDPIRKKVEFVREKKHLQSLAKQTGTTPEKIKQVQIIKEKAKTDKKIAEDWNGAKKGKFSIKQVYKKAIKEPVKNQEQKPTLAQINDKLRKELKKWKEKYHGLETAYETLENKYKSLKNNLQVLIQNPLDKEKNPSPYPSPKELREAELI